MRWIYHEKVRPKWTRWFAWYPVFIGSLPPTDGQSIVWLRWVERHWVSCFDGRNFYEYHEIQKK
jgi:hypothetical protein